MIRLYISEPTPPFEAGLSFALNPDQSRYLTSVMRLHINDELAVFNGRDGEWRASITEAGRKGVKLALKSRIRTQPDAGGPTLVVALIKRTPLEYIVEKATELGVKTIQLVITQRSNSSHTNVERLVSIAKEAAEQTERLDIPSIATPVKLAKWLESNACELIIFGDETSTHEDEERATLPMLRALAELKAGASHAIASTAILIGPEGGFDDAERQALRAHPRVKPVNLGPRILRADTAAISALTLLQAVMGDWR